MFLPKCNISDNALKELISSTDLNDSKLKGNLEYFKLLVSNGIRQYYNVSIHDSLDDKISKCIADMQKGTLNFYYTLEHYIIPSYWLSSDFYTNIGLRKDRKDIRIMFIYDNKYISDVEKIYLKYFKKQYLFYNILADCNRIEEVNDHIFKIAENHTDINSRLYIVENMHIKLPKMEILKIFDKMFPNISPFKSCQLLEMIDFHKTSCEDCKNMDECNDGCKYKIISIKQLLDFSKENFSLL